MVLLPCGGCCGCDVSDGLPRTDPAGEGTWTPSGAWSSGVTWTFTANTGNEDGETWFFYGSQSTSGGYLPPPSVTEDWGNLCNWYSSKSSSPSTISAASLNKRATRLPPATAIVHIYSNVATSSVGPQTVKAAYFWDGQLRSGSEITASTSAHGTDKGVVFSNATTSGTFKNVNAGVINGGALLNGPGANINLGTINGGADLSGLSYTGLNATINGGATFYDDSNISENYSTVNGGATFYDRSYAFGISNVINGGATLYDFSSITGGVTVNGGAVFKDSSYNGGTINDGATFEDTSLNLSTGLVNDGATFLGDSCSRRSVGNYFATPCTKKFVAHPTDLPTCSGTATSGCSADQLCGCG